MTKPTHPELRAQILLYRALCDVGHDHDTASAITVECNPEPLTTIDGEIDFDRIIEVTRLFPANFERSVEATGGRQLDAIALAEAMLADDRSAVGPLLPNDIIRSKALHAAQTSLTFLVLQETAAGRERAVLEKIRRFTLAEMTEHGDDAAGDNR